MTFPFRGASHAGKTLETGSQCPSSITSALAAVKPAVPRTRTGAAWVGVALALPIGAVGGILLTLVLGTARIIQTGDQIRMLLTGVTPSVSRYAPNGELAADCPACPHPQTFHDRIAARFCTATIAGKFNRGCVCTAYPDSAGPNKQNKGHPMISNGIRVSRFG